MTSRPAGRVCIIPDLSGVGGMVSFRKKLQAGLNARGVQVSRDLDDRPYRAVLVIGGSRQLGKLWRARRDGVKIVQRLDGMNWLHHRLRTGVRHYLRAEYGNWLLSFVRANLADRIVYQSQFACHWWEQVHGRDSQPHRVIYNGVDLETFSPSEYQTLPAGVIRILLVEGSLRGGYEMGLENAVQLAAVLAESRIVAHRQSAGVELMVAGRVPKKTRHRWEIWSAQDGPPNMHIKWAGLVPHEKIPEIDRSAHLLFSADLNAACPNSVIEALACGTPVVAFDTGALPELVPPSAGRLADYGGDPWKLESPDLPELVQAAEMVLQAGERLRKGARAQAEALFGLEKMVDEYQQMLLDD